MTEIKLMLSKMGTDGRKEHHTGWFKIYRAEGTIEIWCGDRWLLIHFSRR